MTAHHAIGSRHLGNAPGRGTRTAYVRHVPGTARLHGFERQYVVQIDRRVDQFDAVLFAAAIDRSAMHYDPRRGAWTVDARRIYDLAAELRALDVEIALPVEPTEPRPF